MKSTLIRNTMFFLLLLFSLVAATPERARGIFLISGVFNCCSETSSGLPYCMDNGCWFVSNCQSDSDCQPE